MHGYFYFLIRFEKNKFLKLKPIRNHEKAELCEKLLNGNLSDFRKDDKHFDETSDEDVERKTKNGCSAIIEQYHFDVNSDDFFEEEKNFSVAFSILAHRSAEQLLILLGQIYAPQNVYCVHIDTKASSAMYNALRKVESCFANIRLASKRENVVYSSFSRLQADLNCMEDLLRSTVPWTHLINLSGMVNMLIKSKLYYIIAM